MYRSEITVAQEIGQVVRIHKTGDHKNAKFYDHSNFKNI